MSKKAKTWLDFVIIGAQKAGTTSLFKYLVEHPSIYMPPEKEAPFFGPDVFYERGWDWLIGEFFASAPEDKLWGKASPQYMCYPQVPQRMARQLPQVKLIAILRDPIDRAYSHYKMNVRRGIERRSFEEAMRQQIRAEAVEEARSNPEEINSYIIWGEYGRILSRYLDRFLREQLLVLFTEDLENTPKGVMLQVYDFLGIGAELPKNLGRRYHQGGVRQRFPYAKLLVDKTPIGIMWNSIPWKTRLRIRYWFYQWNTVPDDTVPALAPETLEVLQKHYRLDIDIIQSVLQVMPPWSSYYTCGALLPEGKHMVFLDS